MNFDQILESSFDEGLNSNKSSDLTPNTSYASQTSNSASLSESPLISRPTVPVQRAMRKLTERANKYVAQGSSPTRGIEDDTDPSTIATRTCFKLLIALRPQYAEEIAQAQMAVGEPASTGKRRFEHQNSEINQATTKRKRIIVSEHLHHLVDDEDSAVLFEVTAADLWKFSSYSLETMWRKKQKSSGTPLYIGARSMNQNEPSNLEGHTQENQPENEGQQPATTQEETSTRKPQESSATDSGGASQVAWELTLSIAKHS